jgi:two-component system, OmpR family, response regulator
MPHRRPHILVLDDSPGVCALVEAALDDVGMRISSATTVARARRIMSQDPPDLAIVDIVLAGESGVGIAYEASKRGSRVLMMSGFAGVEEGELPFPFIAKPFAIRELVGVAAFPAGVTQVGELAE